MSCLGHGHPDVLAAMHAQIDALAYAHTSFFSTQVAEELAQTLIAQAPAGITHTYLVSGGSEAMEAALKLARQYFVEKGEPQRAKFIARRNSYHGNTLGALAVGGNEWRRRQFAPLLIDVEHVAPTYAYRDQRDGETPEQYGARLVRGTRGDHRARRRRKRHRVRRRDRRRRHQRLPDSAAGLLPRRARAVRRARHPADPRRSDVRHGPHRAPCTPASRRAWRPT